MYATVSLRKPSRSIIDDFIVGIEQIIFKQKLYEIYDPSKVSVKKRIENLCEHTQNK